MRAHHATNDVGEGTELLSVGRFARQLFEQQVTGTISWTELSASDRAVWRTQAEQALHALVSLGFHLEPVADPESAPLEAGKAVEATQQAIREAEGLLGMGEPLLAYNTLQKVLVDDPGDLRLLQLRGLALARSGALRRANELLAAMREAGHSDGETLGLLARTHKDLALTLEDSAERERHLAAAYDIYAAGYLESELRGNVADGYYTGINAATMAFLRSDIRTAHRIAADVEKLCEQALADCTSEADCYWPQATLAEATLILGNRDAARDRYAAAAALAGSRYGDLSSTRHQARLLIEQQGGSANWLDDVMRVPPVLVYTGHMIDASDREQARFDPRCENRVRDEIHARLEAVGPVAAYGSAACGADILCLECIRELGGELHIILPFSIEQFRATSVDINVDASWGHRFERLLEDANEVLVISEQPPEGCTSTFEYANLIMTGLARLRAQMLDTKLQGLAVWDGTQTGEPGGTGSVVALWQTAGVPFEHVQVGDVVARESNSADVAGGGQSRWPFSYTIESMLFADAVGYSRLTEVQVPMFFEHYAGAIAQLNAETAHRAAHVETAGDGMYMVFDDAGTAGRYALELSELVNGLDWQAVGLPDDLGVRVGLHCGPVFVGRDPITRQALYSGIHTSRTARIEPITPPGQVYASSAFAAVATAQGIKGLRFSYIGRTQLAKHYGVLPLYHVKRNTRRARAFGKG